MSSLEGKRMLVVDDEEMLREVVAEMCQDYGARVVTAANGREAFALFKSHTFDIVLSDVRMPGGDGVELIKNIVAHIKPCPLLFLFSGFSDVTPEKGKELGVRVVFSKPFQSEKLVETIVSHL